MGVPILGIVIYLGLYWVPLFWETTNSRPDIPLGREPTIVKLKKLVGTLSSRVSGGRT